MVENSTNNNKRIAKNTAYLYLRMLFTMVLSLYTARLVLKILGIEDFGIYNVVGGVVTFMVFLTATMSSATQRYLAYELGKGDSTRFKQTFSLLINVYLIFCGIVLVVLELVGPLYISSCMKISPNRIAAAQWVFQFSLLTFLINTISVPYRSSIVAYEKMGAYAYVGIAEAVLHFGIVILLPYIPIDNLITYGFLMSSTSITIVLVMVNYCRIKLENCRYIKYWDWSYVKELISYSGWNLFGSTTVVMNLQGQAIVLNYFFGPLANGAKAVADKVNGMIHQFSQNFYMAVTPQIIKSYATGNIEYMRSLVLNSSRYSFLMLYVISVPLFVVMAPLLIFWLGASQVSFEMIKFCQYTIVFAWVNVLEQPITMAVRATGNIKRYQIIVGSLTLMFIPLCILLFVMGAPAYASMLLMSVIYIIALVARIYIVSSIIHINMLIYVKRVLQPLLFVLIVSLVAIGLVDCFFNQYNVNWILLCICSFIIAFMSSIIVGLRSNERLFLWKRISSIHKKLGVK